MKIPKIKFSRVLATKIDNLTKNNFSSEASTFFEKIAWAILYLEF